jgi:hypothetical protein
MIDITKIDYIPWRFECQMQFLPDLRSHANQRIDLAGAKVSKAPGFQPQLAEVRFSTGNGFLGIDPKSTSGLP